MPSWTTLDRLYGQGVKVGLILFLFVVIIPISYQWSGSLTVSRATSPFSDSNDLSRILSHSHHSVGSSEE